MNKKTAAIVMASLMATGIGFAQEAPKVPDVLTIKGIRLPQDRITLHNGVVAVVTQVTVPQAGKWHFTGSLPVQHSVYAPDGQHYLGNKSLETRFIYTYGAFSKNNPNHIDYEKGLATPAAQPYGTWWFPVNPPGTDFRCQAGDVVYMLVAFYGTSPDLSQAFGSFEGELLVGN